MGYSLWWPLPGGCARRGNFFRLWVYERGGISLVEVPYTAISRKVVEKNMQATIPKGNMGYDQYTVSWHCSCRTYFCCFPLALANIRPWPLLSFFQISLKNREHKKPPTIPFGIVACTFSDNLSRNSCMKGKGTLSFRSVHRKAQKGSEMHFMAVKTERSEIRQITQYLIILDRGSQWG